MPRSSAQELPAIPSVDAIYRTKEGERVVKEIYQGSFVVEWHHSFRQEDVLLATPHYRMIVLVPRDGYGASLLPVGKVVLSSRASRAVSRRHELFHKWSGDLELSRNHRDFLAWRVIHHLLRAAGCDIGISSFDELKSMFIQYKIATGGWRSSTLPLCWLTLQYRPVSLQFTSFDAFAHLEKLWRRRRSLKRQLMVFTASCASLRLVC
jgi:hypothetical protein